MIRSIVTICAFLFCAEFTNACSPYRGPIFYEAFEGNTLEYWTAGQVGLLTVFASTIATGTEGRKTNKIASGISWVGLYMVTCMGATGYPEVRTRDEFETDTRAEEKNLVAAPTDRAEIERQKKEFYRRQAEYDRNATLISLVANLGNAISARGEAARAIGYAGALTNTIYYLLDPNKVRRTTMPVTTFFKEDNGQLMPMIGVSYRF